MSSLRPVAVYGLEVPAGGFITDANPEQLPANFRITMAAIDPTAPPMEDEDTPAGPPRATLKLIRLPFDANSDDESNSDDDDYDEDDVAAIERRLGLTSDDESSDEESNGGPGEKTKEARAAALLKALKEEAAAEEDEDIELTNGVNGTKVNKGKGKASDEEDSDEDSEGSGEELGIEEFVICTLDANQHYQQALDITVNEGEQVFFKTTGAFNIHLTGNYIIPNEEIEDSDEEDEDYEEDDELERALSGYDGEGMSDEEDYSEEDELDDLKDPRIMEIDSDDEAPKLVEAKKDKKGKNKRAAADDDESDVLQALLKPEEANGEKKLSKKQLKKLKNNAGQAAEAPKVEEKAASKKESKKDAKKETTPNKEVNGSAKKVQFAKELEQGPTPTKADNKKGKGSRVVSGVTIDERKSGSGPVAKKGDKVTMRYIGKLKDGKVFDSNTKGEPFKFKLGVGEVIKGWDVGVQGMAAGSERRLVIPANLAYGKQGQKGIPANSELTFDVKLLSIN